MMSCMKPYMTNLPRSVFIILPIILFLTNLYCHLSNSYASGAQNRQNRSGNDEVIIYQMTPDSRGGKAYKLIYIVKAPIVVCWKFKTDFDNDFLVTNKYIREHRMISQNGKTVITEDKYTNGPDVYFRWQTTVSPEAYRMDFVLLNPKQCKQKYHYGYIQLEPVKGGSRITQVAYFDFWGASLWANYPWSGGMKDFLSYTAQWEQEKILHLKDRYSHENPK